MNQNNKQMNLDLKNMVTLDLQSYEFLKSLERTIEMDGGLIIIDSHGYNHQILYTNNQAIKELGKTIEGLKNEKIELKTELTDLKSYIRDNKGFDISEINLWQYLKMRWQNRNNKRSCKSNSQTIEF